MVRLRVPASTANLGPGFDCLGCAVTLSMRCSFQVADRLQITGCPPGHSGPDNLIYRAFREASAAFDMKLQPLHIAVQSDIPLSRGLGSSAAAIVAGVAGASIMAGHGLDRERIFRLAARMEGHPDNVAAAVFGGLRASLQTDERCWTVPFPLHETWRFTALVPDFELSTRDARAVLAQQLPRADALFNLARVPLLLHALQTGDLPLLRTALQDRLHQQQRLPLIREGREVWQAAEAAGAAVYLSGAGPTLMCMHLGALESLGECLPSGWAVMPLEADTQGLSEE